LFAERVAYQYAIEEVYWRHRIWPKENPRPKPLLDAVMPPAQIEKQVEDYLRKSQALEHFWHMPITPEQLQAEMERMARDSKKPEVLRDIFAALGNDPFVIAECLARPILAERLIGERDEARPAGALYQNRRVWSLPEISVPLGCSDDTWIATTLASAPAGRQAHTAVWTGSEMIIWGGAGDIAYNTGARYNPSTDSWTATTTVNAPAGRYNHTVVWTGNEMIVWGGGSNTGGRYNASTDSWTAISTTGAPAAYLYNTAVWTGSQMIIWGGSNGSSLNTGGKYDLSTNSWTATSTNNAPAARYLHTAVWSGSEMIVWGGWNGNSFLNTGGRYNPSTDSWTPTSTTGAPAARWEHTAVWTGSRMIVWGGNNFNTGGSYDPGTGSWTATSIANAPDGRAFHTTVWTGSEMIVWGGYDNNSYVGSGGRYNPSTDSWTATSMFNVPVGRAFHTAVWTGSEMIVWGGGGDIISRNTGGRYCVQPPTPVVQSAVSRKTHGLAGAFDIDLPLSGPAGIECRTTSPTNDQVIVVTFARNVTINGNPQAAVTSGIGTIGSEGKPNGGMVFVSGNTVTMPLTNVANAQTINITLFGVNGTSNFVIPMSVLAGDVNGNGAVNSGDIVATKSRIGQPVVATNFRADVNASGAVNATDVVSLKSNLGTGLP
jgi:N-acetylneuraminic acid mutarotase